MKIALPENYDRLSIVNEFNDLVTVPFGPVNVVLYPRALRGSFNHLARRLAHAFDGRRLGGCIYINQEDMGIAGTSLFFMDVLEEIDIVLQDMKNIAALKDRRRTPQLRVIDDNNIHAQFFENVYRFHTDGNVIGYERIFGCYNDPVTQWLRNEDAIDNKDGSFSPISDQTPVYTFAPGNLWRHAGPGKGYPPFIHRAVHVPKGAPPRLILEAS